MKGFKGILSVLLIVFFSSSLFSQEIFNELQIKYEVKEATFADSPDSTKAGAFDLLNSIEVRIAANDSFYMSKTMGPVENSWIAFLTPYHSSQSKVYGLVAGNKMYGNTQGESLEDSLMYLVDSVIHYFPEDRKEILGYTTFKVEYTTDMNYKNNSGAEVSYQQKVTAYIIEDLYPANELFLEMNELKYLDGIPLEFTIEGPIFDLTYRATDFKRSIAPGTFQFNESEFEEWPSERIRDKYPQGY